MKEGEKNREKKQGHFNKEKRTARRNKNASFYIQNAVMIIFVAIQPSLDSCRTRLKTIETVGSFGHTHIHTKNVHLNSHRIRKLDINKKVNQR